MGGVDIETCCRLSGGFGSVFLFVSHLGFNGTETVDLIDSFEFGTNGPIIFTKMAELEMETVEPKLHHGNMCRMCKIHLPPRDTISAVQSSC